MKNTGQEKSDGRTCENRGAPPSAELESGGGRIPRPPAGRALEAGALLLICAAVAAYSIAFNVCDHGAKRTTGKTRLMFGKAVDTLKFRQKQD